MNRLLLAVLSALFLVPFAAAQGGALPYPTSTAAPAPASAERFQAVPPFSFEDSRGGTLSSADLVGRTWIAVPFFLRCAGPCPSITRDIGERVLPALEGTDIKVVSFSIDPEFDSPEKLSAYADDKGYDRERWYFVSSKDEEAMHAFVKDGLKFAIDRNEDEDDPGLAITHSTRMPIVDGEGRIAGWYEIADPSRSDDPPPTDEAERIVEARYGLLIARARAVAGLDFDAGPAAAGSVRSQIPLLNATLNGLSFVLLLLGYAAIKRGNEGVHRLFMRAAFVTSALFLGFYLYYHFVVLPISGGPTKYNGTGVAKTLYLVMLASHVLLAIVNLPMVLRVLWLAHTEDWDRHKRLARWTFPIWLYVSVTGVAVYLVLYPFNPAPV